MLNGSIRQPPKHQKHFIVDYRDAKYQGHISPYDRIPNGIGTLLNIDYLLVLAKWVDGIVQGSCMAIYPQGNVFYGIISNNVPIGFSSYQISQHKMLYSLIAQDKQSTIIVDCQLSKRLSIAKFRPSQMKKWLKSGENRQKHNRNWDIQEDDFQRNNNIEINQEIKYSKSQDKWQAIEQTIGNTIQPQFKDLKHFVKYNFNTTITPKDQRVQLIQTKQYIQLRNKKAGIVCRLNEHFQYQNRVRFIGYYDSYQEQCDYYRKCKIGIDQQIQQICQGHTVNYKEDRPTICKENLLNYHKKSIHFVNRFLPVKYLEHIQYFYRKIYQLIASELSLKDAQNQLQMGLQQSKYEQRSRIQQKQIDDNKSIQELHNIQTQKTKLQNIQTDIYQKVNRRKLEHHGRLQNLSKIKSQNQFPIRQFDNYPKRYEFKENYQRQLPTISNNYMNEQGSLKNYKEYKYTQTTTPKRSHLNDSSSKYKKRKYQYITTDQPQPYYHKKQEQKINKYHLDISKISKNDQNQRINTRNVEKNIQRAYRQIYKDQSIGDLALNYQQINQQLQTSKIGRQINKKVERSRSPSIHVATPTSKSPSRYSYTKSPYIQGNRGGQSKSKRSWR